MPRNIEIKARLDDLAGARRRAEALTGLAAERIDQDDTFFAAISGRLKLRQFADGSAELIHYQRADTPEAKASDYVRAAVGDAPALREALARALGSRGRVRKTRWLLRHGATRIHLDQVEGLGDFIELEVVLSEGQSDAQGRAVAEGLIRELGLVDAPRIAGAYLDLLAGST